MAATWMLCKNGRSLSGRYHGCHMDALQKRTEFFWTLSWLPHGCYAKRTEPFWTLSWLPHGCSAKTDGLVVDVSMVAAWMLCKTDGLVVDVNMVATWMLCKNGRSLSGREHDCHMDALQNRTESFWTLTWLPHGCSAKTDGLVVDVSMVAAWIFCKTDGLVVDVNMVATWMLCKNGRSLSGREHDCHMDALQDRAESFWTLTWLPRGR